VNQIQESYVELTLLTKQANKLIHSTWKPFWQQYKKTSEH